MVEKPVHYVLYSEVGYRLAFHFISSTEMMPLMIDNEKDADVEINKNDADQRWNYTWEQYQILEVAKILNLDHSKRRY